MVTKEEKPANRKITGRNPDGTFPKGVSGNPSGRPKNTLKDYARQKFMNMTDDEKEAFLKTIKPEELWRMAEGNPANNTELTGKDGAPVLIMPAQLIDKNATPPSTE